LSGANRSLRTWPSSPETPGSAMEFAAVAEYAGDRYH
jgi:hypothetical protein